jgi:hypothetical protein
MTKSAFVGTVVDYTYCSPKAPAFNNAAHAIVVGCILRLALKG